MARFLRAIFIMEKDKAKGAGIFFLGIIVIGGLIQIAGKAKGDPLVFPPVLSILRAFFRLLTTAQTYRLILTSVLHLVSAMLISTVIGVALGMIEGLCAWFRQMVKPLMIMLRSVPVIVLVVIIMVLTKYSRVPVVSAALVLIPLISEATCEGCQNIPCELIDVYRLNSSFNLRVLFGVYLPLMAGYLKQAYINAVGMGMKLVVSAEYLVQTRDSLGKAVYSSSYFNDYEDIYAYALIMILMVLLVSELPLHLMKKTMES